MLENLQNRYEIYAQTTEDAAPKSSFDESVENDNSALEKVSFNTPFICKEALF